MRCFYALAEIQWHACEVSCLPGEVCLPVLQSVCKVDWAILYQLAILHHNEKCKATESCRHSRETTFPLNAPEHKKGHEVVCRVNVKATSSKPSLFKVVSDKGKEPLSEKLWQLSSENLWCNGDSQQEHILSSEKCIFTSAAHGNANYNVLTTYYVFSKERIQGTRFLFRYNHMRTSDNEAQETINNITCDSI